MLSFENYSKAAHRYVYLWLVIGFCGMLIPKSTAQCLVQVPAEPQREFVSKAPLNSSVLNCDGSTSDQFSNENGILVADGITSDLTIASQSEKCITFQNFRINLPEETQIIGFEFVFNGSANADLKTNSIQFISPNGPLGDNNTSALNGMEWPRSQNIWSYGDKNNTWGAGIGMLEILDPNFGVFLNISNEGDQPVSISLDQVSLVVHYKPVYMVCDHDCITFFVAEDDGVEYDWTIPDDFHILEGTQVNHIINIVASDDQKGSFEICLNAKQNGDTDSSCCRTFILENCGKSSLGDQVWLDQNGNGLFDVGESGITDMTVNLYNESSEQVATTLTNQDGGYLFESIDRGYYYLEFVTDLIQTVSTDDLEQNSDVTNLFGKGTTDEFYLPGSSIKLDLDAGFFEYAHIGDFVWNDLNQNGIQEENEPGFGNVDLDLNTINGSIVASTTTDDDGRYMFQNVDPGIYTLDLKLPDGYTLTQNDLSNPDNNSDFQILNNTASTQDIMLISGQSKLDIDAGLVDNTSDIKGVVWCDTNQDNLRDEEENGIADIRVSLYLADGSLVAETLTNELGQYTFNQVIVDNYYIVFEPSFGKEFGQANAGNESVDSDVTSSITYGSTDIFKIDLGGTEMQFDAGQQINIGNVSGLVWQDIELDDLLGADDDRLDGISVSLYDMASNLVAKVETDIDGSYIFENIKVGHYYLSFMVRDGHTFVRPNSGMSSSSSSVTAANGIGTTADFEVLPGETTINLNAGYVVNVADVFGVVWCDTDRNGLRSSEEERLENIRVQLFDENSNLIKSTITNSAGEYSFYFNLTGRYYVQFERSLEKVFTENLVSDQAINSDVTGANGPGTTDVFAIGLGGDPFYKDAGQKVISGSITGLVWMDDDFDGLRIASEGFVSAWQVTLLNSDGDVINTQNTDENGKYIFDELGVGIYQVQFEERYPFLYAPADLGDDDTDSDVINQNGETNKIEINTDGQVQHIDAGVLRNEGEFKGVVWCDENCNGLKDGGEKGEPDVNVFVLDVTGKVLFSTTTDANGEYIFENLAANKYYVKIDETRSKEFTLANVGNNEGIDSDITHEIEYGSTGTIYINAAISEVIIDAGLKPIRGDISGIVWDDVNYDGQRDDSESLVNGLVVQLLLGENNIVANTTTDINGSYRFTNVLAEDYTIKFINISNHTFTKANIGAEATDSDVTDVGSGITELISIFSNNDQLFVDAGIVKNVADISGIAWCDNDFDGVFSTGDSRLANQEVSIIDFSGASIATTTTDNTGAYLFVNVAPGSYFMRFESIVGKTNTTSGVGNDNDINSQITNSNGPLSTDTFVIGPATDDYRFNAGYVLINGSIKGIVWEDEKVDGTRLDSESRVAGVEVQLIQNGEIIDRAITDSDGSYLFNRVLQGSYHLYFDAPEYFLFTLANVGAEQVDSDVTNSFGMGTTVLFDLESNGQCLNVDAGIASSAADIDGFVWCDDNKNGLQEDTELGIANLVINLIDHTTDQLVTQVNTQSNGEYVFSKIPIGKYYLIFELMEDKKFTVYNGSDDDKNSDVTGVNGIGSSNTFEIRLGDKNYSFDAGQTVLSGTINGTVWEDTHFNGVRSSTEDLVSDIEVALYSDQGMLISTKVTNDLGNYYFPDVSLGNYYLVFSSPECFTYTLSNRESDALDSDVTNEIVSGSTAIFSVSASSLDQDYDMGLVTNAANLSGVLWCDDNANGLRESGEATVSNLYVELVNALTGATIRTFATSMDGTYEINKAPVGMYFLRFEKPENKEFTIAISGMDMMNSDVTEMNGPGTTDMFMIRLGDTEFVFDSGYVPNKGSITGLVWNDMNFNGVRESEEENWEGLTVRLLETDNVMLSETITDDRGSYSFLDLDEGEYQVEFKLPEDYIVTQANQGDDGMDSDVQDENGLSEKIFISNNGEIQTVDLGIVRNAGAAMGVVWCEEEPNGIRELGEAGLSNLTVTILDDDDVPMGQTFTNSNGLYVFPDLAAGDYYIQVSGVEGKYFSPANQGNDESKDSDITGDSGFGTSDRFNIGAENMVVQVDAGMSVLSGVVSGRLWDDVQLLGVQDSNEEEGVSRVEIRLFSAQGDFISTTISSANGTYIFNNIAIGSYYLQFDEIEKYDFTIPGIGMESADSDVTGSNGLGTTDIFTIPEGSTEFDFDVGYVRNDGSISGIIWEDGDEDGIRENGENLIADIKVILYNQNNTIIAETISQNDGQFIFENIPMGTYYVVVQNETSTRFSDAYVGELDDIDSDITSSIAHGSTDLFVLLPGERISDFGAGIIYTRNCITGSIWEDLDGDGLREEAEPIKSNIQVVLRDQNDQAIMATRTNADGSYKFSDLDEGFYYVEFIIFNPYRFTLSDQGTDELADSDISGELGDGTSHTFLIGNGQTIAGVNAGVYIPASLAGEIWIDDNLNNIQDTNETLLSDVSVQLLDSDGSVVQSVIATMGDYIFTNIRPGAYTVRFEIDPDYNYVSPIETDASFDSDVTTVNQNIGQTGIINVKSNDQLQDIDAGISEMITLTNTIGNQVFLDDNGNGIRDANESGINNIIVNLFSAAGDMLSSTTTTEVAGQDGIYTFEELSDGDYYIQVVLNNGFEFTAADIGENELLDSDITGANGTGSSDLINLSAGQGRSDIDVGIYQPVTIGDFVWNDGNANGIQNNNEDGINNVRVRLFDTNFEQVAQTFTDIGPDGQSGYYNFSVAPGEYFILVQVSAGLFFTENNLGGNGQIDSDITGINGFGTSDTFILTSGQVNNTIDAGMLQDPANLGDFVWIDENANGIQDDEEVGINDVVVNLYDIDMQLVATDVTKGNMETGDSGAYFFESIAPGTYYVEFVIPEGTLPSRANQGGDDTLDSDITNVLGPGTTHMFELSSDETDLDVDGGFFYPSFIGDFVWDDLNQNGTQDAGEPGIAGVEVRLTRQGIVMDVTMTDQNGFYQFMDLTQGLYAVNFTAPSGYTFTANDIGSDDARDSDVFSDGSTPLISLAHDVQFNDLDCGMYKVNQFVGVDVFHDLNANGLREDGDDPMQKVSVTLFEESGKIVMQTESDSLGKVAFQDVADGSYFVQVATPADYKFSDVELQNQVDVFGYSDVFQIQEANNNIVIPASVYQPIVVKTKVWRDIDGDGIMQDTEPKLNDVPVLLKNEIGEVVSADITGRKDDGMAVFEGLKPGNYMIYYQPLPEYVETTKGLDDTGAFDSDVLALDSGFATDQYDLLSTDRLEHANAGFYKECKIGDRVWFDENHNGFQDDGEEGVADVTVNLYDGQARLVKSAITDADGQYGFDRVKYGAYYLEFLTANGVSFTQHVDEFDTSMNSDVSGLNGEGTTWFFELDPEERNHHLDAGLVFGVLAIDDASLQGSFMGDYNQLEIQPVDQTGIKTYILERSLDPNIGFTELMNFEAGSAEFYSYRDFEIKSGQYYYRIKEVDDSGFSENGQIIVLSVKMNNESEATMIQVLPNPASDYILVRWDHKNEWNQLELIDARGQLIRSKILAVDQSSLSMDMSTIAKGNYFVKLSNAEKQEVQQIAINR